MKGRHLAGAEQGVKDFSEERLLLPLKQGIRLSAESEREDIGEV